MNKSQEPHSKIHSIFDTQKRLVMNNIKNSKDKFNIVTRQHFIKGEKLEYINNNLSNKKILMLSLVKDCIRNSTLETMKDFIAKLTERFGSVHFGILTNNNFDQTPQTLLEWQKKNHNIYIIEYKDERIDTVNNNLCGNRIDKLASYREILLRKSCEYFNTVFDYVIVFDSDVIFDTTKIVNDIIESVSIQSQWSAISANNCYDKSKMHYDTLALRLPKQPIDIQKIYPSFQAYYGINYHWNTEAYIFQDFVEVQCAFGGLTIYNGKEIHKLLNEYKAIYDINNLPPCTCEHIAIDLKLQKKHYINSNMKLPSHGTLEGHLYKSPTLFIPRDAGFFSVFNFLIGTIYQGIRAYPYFNRELFLKYRKENKHFCYWTNNENSWMDYCEPIRYYETDNEHIDKTFLAYRASGGEDASEEFKTPQVFTALLKDKSLQFADWRTNIHNVYSQYIQWKPKLIQDSNTIFSNMFSTTDYVIGLHYRHPSHSVESGPLFLTQYYQAIDEILTLHPRAKIFLATDTDFGIMAFKYKYGNRIHYLDTTERLPVDNILEWAYALNTIGQSDNIGIIQNRGYELHQSQIFNGHNNNYLKFTNNLLLEILCLSKCNILVNAVSNISLALSYINPSVPIVTI